MAGASDTLINTLFDGRYRILRKLGSGGMANVYLAEDEELGRRVAIKILNERYANDDLFIERFRREAKSAAGLSHPNIVSIYDRGEAEGTYYIAMEVIEGRSLKELILTHRRAPDRHGDRVREAAPGGAPLRAPPRDHPPRHQAAQRPRLHRPAGEGDGAAPEGDRLRDRAPRRVPDDRGRVDHGDGAVPLAGAGARRARDGGVGPLLGGRRALRDADGQGAVHGRLGDRDRHEARQRAAQAAVQAAPRDPARARPGRPPLARQGSRPTATRRPTSSSRTSSGSSPACPSRARPPRPRPRCSPGRRSARRRRCSRARRRRAWSPSRRLRCRPGGRRSIRPRGRTTSRRRSESAGCRGCWSRS